MRNPPLEGGSEWPSELKFYVLRGQKTLTRRSPRIRLGKFNTYCKFLIFEIGFARVDAQTWPRINSDQKRAHKYGPKEEYRGHGGQKMESEVQKRDRLEIFDWRGGTLTDFIEERRCAPSFPT